MSRDKFEARVMTYARRWPGTEHIGFAAHVLRREHQAIVRAVKRLPRIDRANQGYEIMSADGPYLRVKDVLALLQKRKKC